VGSERLRVGVEEETALSAVPARAGEPLAEELGRPAAPLGRPEEEGVRKEERKEGRGRRNGEGRRRRGVLRGH